MERVIRELIESITERYDMPIRVGSRCEADTFYRVDDIPKNELEAIAEYIAERILKVCYPHVPDYFIQLEGNYTGIAEIIAEKISTTDKNVEVITYDQMYPGSDFSAKLRSSKVILTSDVITTARSAVEAHTKATMMGASVLCWASIIDRTFGPGPVPVVASFTGEPVTLLREII